MLRDVTQQEYVEWLVAGTPLPVKNYEGSSSDASVASPSSKSKTHGGRERDTGVARETEAWATAQRCLDEYVQRCSVSKTPVDDIYSELLSEGEKVVKSYLMRGGH